MGRSESAEHMIRKVIIFTALEERELALRAALEGAGATVVRCAYPAVQDDFAKFSRANVWIAFGDELTRNGSEVLGQITERSTLSSAYSLVVADLADVQQPAPWLYSFDDWILADNWTSILVPRLRCMSRIAETASESQAQCIRLSSHDINNPLTAIRILSEMLMGDISDPMLSQDLSDILEASDVAAGMVESLTLYLKAESGFKSLDRSAYDLGAIIEEVIRRPALREKVKFERGEGCCAVLADRIQLRSAMVEVLMNARKMTDGRSIVNIRLQSGNERVTLLCTSVGMSIPEGMCPHLVERYGAHVLREKRYPVAPSALYAANVLIEAQGGAMSFGVGSEGGLQVICSFPMANETNRQGSVY